MAAFEATRSARPAVIVLKGHRFDTEADELLDEAGEPVRIRPQCLGVLRCLAASAGRVVTKQDLMRAVWPGTVVTDDSLVQCISELRRALGDANHRVVRTELRRGYRLVPSSTAGGAPASGGFPQEVRFATSYDGVRIAYTCSGNGVPVVRDRSMSHLDYEMDCLAGGPIHREMANRYRLIRYDRRGQGLSDRHATISTIEQMLRDLIAVVDAEGLARFVLWSFGAGPPAIRFAARYPDRVERLILQGAQARGLAGRRDDVYSTIPAADVLLKELWEDESSMVRSGGGPISPSRQYPTGTLEQVRSYDRFRRVSCTAEGAMAWWRAAKYWNVAADLERVRCPTLVLHSQRNRTVLFEEAELIAARVPDNRFVALDTDNWMPLPQEPAFDVAVREIHAFIAQSRLVDTVAAPATPAADESFDAGSR